MNAIAQFTQEVGSVIEFVGLFIGGMGEWITHPFTGQGMVFYALILVGAWTLYRLYFGRGGYEKGSWGK